MKKIVIAGGSGFLGQALKVSLEKAGYEVVILSRTKNGGGYVKWNAKTQGEWRHEIDGAFAVLNMAGKSVDCRYTDKNKKLIMSSRIDSTKAIGQAIKGCSKPPEVWLNSSTATIYKYTHGKKPANTEEEHEIGSGFSVEVAKAWETEFFSHKTPQTVQTALRTSIVYGKSGGALPVVYNLAKKGLCSKQGSGKQWISWIHIEDFCRAILFLLENPQSGAVNMCAPGVIQNKDFYALLRKYAKAPICLPQPAWLLEIGAFVMRTETELILKSRKVYPAKLLDKGFSFEYPDCKTALDDLLT